MPLLLQDTEIVGLVPLGSYVDAMEAAFRDFSDGVAPNPPRMRFASSADSSSTYFMNLHSGAVPSLGVSAVRIDSNLMAQAGGEINRRMQFFKEDARHHGLILLYSLRTSELLAICQEFSISGYRVAATTALALKYLARADAETLGLFGTGRHARLQLEIACAVRPIRQVLVYSPNAEHLSDFIEEYSSRYLVPLRAATNPNQLVDESEIICCATNSSVPVFDGARLSAGQTVTTIVNSDVVIKRTEVDDQVFTTADRVVIHDTESVQANGQIEMLGPLEQGTLNWSRVALLGDIVAGKTPGRLNSEEIIYYKANTGMAIQFAAACAAAYQAAIDNQVGTNLPSALFSTDISEWYARGYFPGG